MDRPPIPLARCVMAEIAGTFMLVFFGCGAVHSAVLMDGLTGLWQVGIVWGISIMLAIYTVGGISGAHINPAITIGLAAWNRFPVGRVVPYVLAQIGGAMLAAAALYVMFSPFATAKERSKQVARGQTGSVITAMCFGEYYPNPGALAGGTDAFDAAEYAAMRNRFPAWRAFFAEVLGTLILACVVGAFADEENSLHPGRLAPAFIGLTVTALICVITPLTQACFNPARDFGPRLFAYFAGWGSVAIPGPNGHGFVTVYIIAPILGAILGVGLYHGLFQQRAAAKLKAT